MSENNWPSPTEEQLSQLGISRIDSKSAPAQESKAESNWPSPTKDQLDEMGIVPENEGVIDAINRKIRSIPSTTLDTVKDFGTGTLQGATMGFSDELGAAFDANLRVDSKESWLDSYRKNQKRREAANEKAYDRSPIAANVGDLGASVLMPTGILGGAKALAKAGKLTKLERMLNPASSLGKIAATGAEVAAAGGIAGAGYSRGDLGDGSDKLVGDIGTGATLGGLLGAAGEAIGQGASKVKNYVTETAKDSRDYDKIKRAYDLGTEGKKLLGKNAEKETRTALEQTVKPVGEAIMKGRSNISSQVGEEIAKATDTFSKDQVMNNFLQSISEEERLLPGFAEKIENIASILPETMSVKDLKSKVDNLYKLAESGKLPPELAAYIYDFNKSATSLYPEAVRNKLGSLKSFAEGVGEQFLDQPGQKIQDMNNKWGTQKTAEYVADKIKDTILKAERSGAGEVPQDARLKLDKVLEYIKSNPEIIKESGFEDIMPMIEAAQSAAMNANIAGSASAKGINNGALMDVVNRVIGFGASTSEGGTLQRANLFGRANKVLQGVTPSNKATGTLAGKALVSIKDIYSLPVDKMIELGAKIGGAKGEALTQAVKTGNEIKKRAVLFAIAQDPKMRQFFSDGEE